MGKHEPAPTRFWRKVDRAAGPGACWPWTGGRKTAGYGNFCVDRRTNTFVIAHRYAYEQVHGAIPDGMYVCHRCDNPWCCNPAHLFVGTAAENNRDMRQKGRAPRVVITESRRRELSRVRGRLTEDQVRAIWGLRASRRSAMSVARELGVSYHSVHSVWRGQYQWVALDRSLAHPPSGDTPGQRGSIRQRHLTDDQARVAMTLRGTMTAARAAAQFGVKPGVIYALWEGLTYRWIALDFVDRDDDGAPAMTDADKARAYAEMDELFAA